MSEQEGKAVQGKPIVEAAVVIGWDEDGKLQMQSPGANPASLVVMLEAMKLAVLNQVSLDKKPQSKVIPIRAMPDIVDARSGSNGKRF